MAEFNGTTVLHRDINAEYLLLVAGVDGDKVTYQAYARQQMTHRLWTIPQTEESVRGFLKTGLLKQLITLDDVAELLRNYPN